MFDTMWHQALAWGGLVLIWLGGEAGRTFIAGASGGFTRWLMSEGRRLRDGVISVITGAVMAPYLGPAVLAIFEAIVGDMGEGAEVKGFSYFTAGLLGMSLAKIIVALIEAKARQLNGGDDA